MASFYVDYSRGEFIECGSFGEVCRVRRKSDGVECALKTIFKSKLPRHAFSSDEARFPAEIEFLKRLNHPNIIKYVDSFEDAKSFYLIMELVAKSMDLFDFTRKRNDTTEDVLAYIFSQIADATLYLHWHDIAHLDMKLENIVIGENLCCKIIDFGSAAKCHDYQLFYYPRCAESSCSPEIWSGRSYNGKDADCWALGVVLYRLCYRRLPFETREDAVFLEYTLPEGVSAELRDLFSRIFHGMPQCRADAWEIRHNQWTRTANGRGYTMQHLIVEEGNDEAASVDAEHEDGYSSVEELTSESSGGTRIIQASGINFANSPYLWNT